jgi:hypothetical protein
MEKKAGLARFLPRERTRATSLSPPPPWDWGKKENKFLIEQKQASHPSSPIIRFNYFFVVVCCHGTCYVSAKKWIQPK